MRHFLRRLPLIALIGLAACATVPSGPSHLVLPGSRKTFDQFRADDAYCRQYAHEQIAGMTPNEAAADSGVRSAVIGTAIGAAAGAVIGGGRGAAIGGGAGLLVGSAAGANAAAESSYTAQQRYDYGYEQCMYAKGHKVPVTGRFASSRAVPAYPPRNYPPPPPPNYPPPNYPPPDQPPPNYSPPPPPAR